MFPQARAWATLYRPLQGSAYPQGVGLRSGRENVETPAPSLADESRGAQFHGTAYKATL